MDDDLQTYRFGPKPFISAFIHHFSDIVAVNLLMALSFLTIVGIPAAFVAGAAVFLRIFRNEPYSLRRDYFTAFRREFRRSLIVGFAILVLEAASIFAASLYYRMSVGNPLLAIAAILCIALAFVWLASSFYLWPMLAIVDLPAGVIFKNSLQLAFLAAHAAATGAHATSAVPCVYYRPGEESIYRHWTAITEAADLPFFIYNIPQLTGYSLSMPMFRRMLQNERVAGIKCSSESVQDIMHFKKEGGKDFIVFNGPDEQYLAGRIMGADAGIGGTYAAMPELYLKLENLIRERRIDVALNLQRMITAFIARLCAFGSLYGTVKAIVRLDGCDIGDTRAPFLPVSSENPDVVQLYRDIKAAIRDTASW